MTRKLDRFRDLGGGMAEYHQKLVQPCRPRPVDDVLKEGETAVRQELLWSTHPRRCPCRQNDPRNHRPTASSASRSRQQATVPQLAEVDPGQSLAGQEPGDHRVEPVRRSATDAPRSTHNRGLAKITEEEKLPRIHGQAQLFDSTPRQAESAGDHVIEVHDSGFSRYDDHPNLLGYVALEGIRDRPFVCVSEGHLRDEASEGLDPLPNRIAKTFFEDRPCAGSTHQNDGDCLPIDRAYRDDSLADGQGLGTRNRFSRDGIGNDLHGGCPLSGTYHRVGGKGRDRNPPDVIQTEQRLNVDLDHAEFLGRDVHSARVGCRPFNALTGDDPGDPFRGFVLVGIAFVEASHEDGLIAEFPQQLERRRV